MSKGKIRQIYQGKLEDKKKIEDDWQDFLKKDTYLIFDENQQFIDIVNQLARIPRISWFYFRTRKKLKIIQKDLKGLEEVISNYNKIFIQKRLGEYSTFFEGKDDNLKFPLDEDQRLAIIKDDKHNLVVAGAGSGKTSVLTARIAYLIRRKDKIDPEKILALAFTRNAAKEMEERIRKNYRLKVSISTFHSLGWNIIKEETKERPKLLFDGNEHEIYFLITDIFKNLLNEKKFQEILIQYIAYHPEQEVKEESFEHKQKYYRYMRNKKYSTLNNIEVKSIGERDVGNFLFLHDIEFKYEPLVDWVDKDEEDKDYHPDFYLPEHDIYIEYWGLNERCEVAPWFTITSQEYLEMRKWKLEQFEKHQKVLVETWNYERTQGSLVEKLKQKLKDIKPDIDFKPIPYEELIEKVFSFKEQRNEISKLIVSFIRIAKANYLKPKKIEKRIGSGKYTQKQVVFGTLALEVYKRYQEFLLKEDKIDFNDMINLAVKLVKENPEKYLEKYDHILIDEFQDISHQRMKLIQRFINENSDTKLFCVGDDYQSIYQFTGSDVRFFVNFKDYFPNPEISILSRNYRSSREIVDMSNNLISYNKKQIKKNAYSIKGQAQQPILIELTSKLGYSFRNQISNYYNLINTLLSNGVRPSDIMVLSRFNRTLKDLEEYCGAKGIPTEYKAGGVRFHSAHGSKGLESKHVIIMNANSGLYGFPCEIQDSSVMELAKRFVTDSYFEEERRLFYVALTRSKKFLYVYSIEEKNSMFLNEINPYLMNVCIDTGERWHQGLSEFFSFYIKGISLEVPMICPRCGRLLTERIRRSDGHKFIGCTGFSATGCKFTYDSKKSEPGYLYSKKEEKKKIFNPEPVLNTEKILQAINSDLLDINNIAEKLTITDQLDIRYLKIKLKELERKKFIISKNVDKIKYWRIPEKRSSKKKNPIFILELENNKWWIGRSKNPSITIATHREGKGNIWTRENGVIKIEDIIKEGDLTNITIRYIKKYGWQNIRGTSFNDSYNTYIPKKIQKCIESQDGGLEYLKENEDLTRSMVVFILRLEHGKWYIGKSSNVNTRVSNMRKGGNKWTQMNKIIALEEVRENADLKEVTLEHMRKYGWENVRGYAWSQWNMKNPPKELRQK